MKRALVTGGGGFLGLQIVRELIAAGVETTSLSRRPHPALEKLGVKHVCADLSEAGALDEAFQGQDTVFHTAAKAGVFGPLSEYQAINEGGTRHALAAAVAAGVRRFVHTSSPSVVFDGTDHLGAGRDLPYPKRYLAAYPRSKAAAERLVLQANRTPSGSGVLATCALRPHLIFGPGDPHIVPRLLERARAGRLRIVGPRSNTVSLTYVENAALAHVQAAQHLTPDAPHAGRPTFVNQTEPVVLWDWIAELLRAADLELPQRAVPAPLAYAGGAVLESAWKLLALRGEPPMTRFVARQLAKSHTYDMEPARRDFGYIERVSLSEANRRTFAWVRDVLLARA